MKILKELLWFRENVRFSFGKTNFLNRIRDLRTGRKEFLFIIPTFSCFRNCDYCYNRAVKSLKTILNPNDLDYILDQNINEFDNRNGINVVIYGGEPVLISNLLPVYYEILQKKVKIKSFNILTGLYYPLKIFESLLKSIERIKNVSISISTDIRRYRNLHNPDLLFAIDSLTRICGVNILNVVDYSKNFFEEHKYYDFLYKVDNVFVSTVFNSKIYGDVFRKYLKNYMFHVLELLELFPNKVKLKKYKQGFTNLKVEKRLGKFVITGIEFQNKISIGCDKTGKTLCIFPDSKNRGVGFCHSIILSKERHSNHLFSDIFRNFIKIIPSINGCERCVFQNICDVSCVARFLESKFYNVRNIKNFCRFKMFHNLFFLFYKESLLQGYNTIEELLCQIT